MIFGIVLATATVAAIATVFNAVVRPNDDAPRDVNHRNLEAIRQSVINNTRGNQDWLDVDAQDAVERDFARACQGWLLGVTTEQRNSDGPAAEFEEFAPCLCHWSNLVCFNW